MRTNNEFRSEKKVTMTPEDLSQETLHAIPLDSVSPPPWNNDSHPPLFVFVRSDKPVQNPTVFATSLQRGTGYRHRCT
jgi:hypothetical protein